MYYRLCNNIDPYTKRNIDVLFIYDGCLFIGEMKGPGTSGNDPLLKPLLEIETYSKIIYSENFINDFTKNLKWVKEALSESHVIKKAIIVYEKKDGKSQINHFIRIPEELWKCRFRGHPRSSDSDRILGGRAWELAF